MYLYCTHILFKQENENLRVGVLLQTIPEGALKKAEEKPVRERMKRKSSSEDVVPYDGLRVATFDNKKQHIVHCGKCLGEWCCYPREFGRTFHFLQHQPKHKFFCLRSTSRIISGVCKLIAVIFSSYKLLVQMVLV